MTRFVRPHIARMAGYVPGEQPQGGGFIKLNTNENPYPPSPRVKAALAEAVDDRLRLYPDPMATAFLPHGRASCTASSPTWSWRATARTTCLTIITRAFVGPGDLAGFPVAELLALFDPDRSFRTGGRWSCRTRATGRSNQNALAVPGLKLFFLANPDSPSGTAHDARADRRAGRDARLSRWSSTRPMPISPSRATMPCRCSTIIPT